MKLIVLLLIMLTVNGCSLLTSETSNDKSSSNKQLSEDIGEKTTPGTDDFYMNIAKDLYTAEQYKQAYQISAELAKKNNVEAQYLLGYLYYYGQGVPLDVKQGIKWISASANSGYRPAIEALVLIKHGLTPDNKCPSIDFYSDSIKRNKKSLNNSDDSNKK